MIIIKRRKHVGEIKRRCGCVVYPVKRRVRGRSRKYFRYTIMCQHHRTVNAGMAGFVFGVLASLFLDYARRPDA
jgi:hypothetical protein